MPHDQQRQQQQEHRLADKQLFGEITSMITQECPDNLNMNPKDDESKENDATMKNDSGLDDSVVLIEGGSCLKRKDIKAIHARCTIWLKQECEYVSQKRVCNPHPSIQMKTPELEIMGGEWPWEMTDFHQEDLNSLISRKETTWSQRLIMMKKLTLPIKHLHSSDDSHGNLNEECITISSDGRDRPFIWKMGKTPEHATLHSDIKNLGMIFYAFLTQGGSFNDEINILEVKKCLMKDAEDLIRLYAHDFTKVLPKEHSDTLRKVLSEEPVETAKDLIQKMLREELNIEEVLKHPLFWSDNDKATFIADLFDSMGGNSEVFDELEQESKQSVFNKSWIEELRLSPAEKTTIVYIQSENNCNTGKPIKQKGNVNKNLLFDMANRSENKRGIKISQYVLSNECLEPLKVEEAENKAWKRLKKQATAEKENTPENGKKSEIPQAIKQEYPWVIDEDQCVIMKSVVFKKEDKKYTGYDGTSLYDLVRFIRNRKVHCWEGKNGIIERQYYEHLGGFWNFYSRRFPKLLMILYNGRDKFPFYADINHLGKQQYDI